MKATSEETLNLCVVIPAFLTLANLIAVSSKEKMQDLALSHTTCKSTRLQMGNSSSYGNNGRDTRIGRSQTTPPITSSAHTPQQVSEISNTQLKPPAPFAFFRAESHTREPGQGTNVYRQHGKPALLCVNWFIAKSQSDKGSLDNPTKMKWELRKITDKQSIEDRAIP